VFVIRHFGLSSAVLVINRLQSLPSHLIGKLYLSVLICLVLVLPEI
jgi:hypothetical protein